ncbi:MAG: hypothetical protein Q8891_04820 [Bacteroidota bacterium]|nr:hypothetical protein [Bacteroidota bacterium]
MMKKHLRQAVKNFKRLPDSKLLVFGQNVTVSMAIAVNSFPNPIPALADINAVLIEYTSLLQLATSRNRVQIALKNQCRQTLIGMLSLLVDYTNLVAQGNPAMLAQSGFDLSKIPEPIWITEPTYLALKDGSNSGELTLHCKQVRGALSYLFQYTSDTQLSEESWVSIAATTVSYTFKNLTRGTTYYCRVVAIGANKQMVNSIVVNRVSQ